MGSSEVRESNLLKAATVIAVQANVAKSEEPSTVLEESSDNYHVNDLIAPPYKLEWLRILAQDSSELMPVVSSMVANTIGYGYRVVPRAVDEAGETSDEKAARIQFENFWNYANSRESMKQVLERAAWDYFIYGNMYLEITRNSRGLPDGITRIPAHEVRASRLESEPFRVRIKQVVRTATGYGIRPRLEAARFRRYAQLSSGVPKVWFKEFQDTRAYNRETGELAKTSEQAREWKRDGKLANELIHIAAPFRIEPYGLPAYVSNITAINGDINAGKINDATFSCNNMPSMAILVSGMLTEGSTARIKEFVETNAKGNVNRSRFLVLEAEATSEDSETARPTVQIEPLAQLQQNDVMFQKFSDECRAAIRRSFRLPQTLIARGEQISGAVVAASMKLAEEQIFSQERDRFVEWINRRLLPELGIASIVIELNSPNTTDPATLANLLTTGEKSGGLTPRIGRQIFEMILGRDLGEFKGDFDPDIPFTITVAERVKKVNESGANNPSGSRESRDEMNGATQTELTQQITSDRTPS